MTYNLITVDPLGNEDVAKALARCFGVPVRDVDVADEQTDQTLRSWDAAVLCDRAEVRGDVTTSLDVHVQDRVPSPPDEAGLARAFARAARTVVLCPAIEELPSAYWLMTDQGTVTRARLLLSDDEEPVYTVDAVEAAVPRLPHVPVRQLPEIVREQSRETSLSTRAGRAPSSTGGCRGTGRRPGCGRPG
ncbi:hypothetical protein [Streptomyces sp. NPDC050145]|uniref:hypothetical protein n=1 Tax=Streptomyces sp. NPDC050145 TaxID=3365602 RepID=UPI003797AC15